MDHPTVEQSQAQSSHGGENTAEIADSRWPAIIAVLAVGGIYTALPASLSVGPRWLLPIIVCVLCGVSVAAHHTGRYRANMIIGHLLAVVLTGFMLWSLVLLLRALPAHRETPEAMLRSAAALWVSNILIFALWYWRLDAGGPRARFLRDAHTMGAFLFPQMSFDPRGDEHDQTIATWSPMFVDYLFLAFNTSTALSPTDAPILSRWAKVLVMMQASISLTIVIVLVARAINIL